MIDENRKAHWKSVYANKAENEVSWFQEDPTVSLELLLQVGATSTSSIIDIGGGASRLVDSLLARDYEKMTVLDISATALAMARKRVGRDAKKVKWIEADVTVWDPQEIYDIWHDRAAFHFLVEEVEQTAYIQRLKKGLRHGGHVIIGTFAIDGPEKCSGLQVARQTSESLAAVLGPDFVLVDSRRDEHVTPSSAVQKFQFSTFCKVA